VELEAKSMDREKDIDQTDLHLEKAGNSLQKEGGEFPIN